MGDKRPYKPRKPGAGRKPLKPDYNAAAILQEQIQTAVVLYEEDNSLQTIADILEYDDVGVKTINKFNPIPYSTLKNSYFVVYRRGLGNI